MAEYPINIAANQLTIAQRLPIEFNRVMKESWNADHQDFISMIDAHRQAGVPFEASWAGSGMVRVYSRVRKGGAEDVVAWQERKQAQENLKALELWSGGKGRSVRFLC